MYFSLIRLRRDVSPKEVVALSNGDTYQVHKLIWNLFSDGSERRRDFLYRYEAIHGWPTFYTVSAREPNDPSNLWKIQSKEYSPKIAKGDRLAFSLRVNPIRSKRDGNDKQHRHDVVMEAKTRLGFKALPLEQRPHIAVLVQEAGVSWLQSRETELGFTVDESEGKQAVRADGYVQHRLSKGKGAKPVTFSTLDFNGVLEVVDPDRFVGKSLYEGIGPAKGFGCGLMLVKRI